MSRDAIRAALGARQRIWTTRDTAALAAGHTEDGTVISPMFVTVSGRIAIRNTYENLFRAFPDWEHALEEPIIDGDRVAQPFLTHATHRGEFMGLSGTGKRFEIEGVHLYDMRGELIHRERRVYDFTGLLLQLGVLRGRLGR